MSCPECLVELEGYSVTEGGWCPKCEEWYPSDVVEEWLQENE